MKTIKDLSVKDIKEIKHLQRNKFPPDSICKRYDISIKVFNQAIKKINNRVRKIGPSELDQIKELVNDGFKSKYIAQHFGVHVQYINELKRTKLKS